jgi:succinoglycan biosynthesis transport protein ExoP
MKPLEEAASVPAWMHPLSLIRGIWKRKISFVMIVAVLSGTVVVVVHRLPAIYRSDAVILVDSQKIPDRYVSSSVNTDVGDRLATISQQILSSSRLKKIIQDFDLYREDRKKLVDEEVLEELRHDIEIKVEKGWSGNRPGAFRVGYQGPDPTVVAGVANRLANLFVDENLHAREIQAEGTSEFIVSELEGAKKKLDELEAAVSKYKMEHNGELPQQESALIVRLTSLQTQSQANQEAINRAQQNKVMLENGLTFYEGAEAAAQSAAGVSVGSAGTGSATSLAPATNWDSGSAQPTSIEQIEARLEFLRAHYTDQYPEVKVLNYELARLRGAQQQKAVIARAKEAEAVKQETEKSKTGAVAANTTPPPAKPLTAKQVETEGRIVSIKAQLKLSEEDLESRVKQQGAIQHEIAGMQARIENLPVREQEMAGLMRDYEISKANYKSLLDKQLSAEMGAEMERRQKAERFTVIDPARVPEKPIKPNRPLFSGLGIFFSLVIALGISTARELKRDAMLGEWELPAGTVILGRVPRINKAGQALDRADQGKTSPPPVPHAAEVVPAGLYYAKSPWMRIWRWSKDV